MERKEISAILVDDFENFLRQNDLYEKYVAGQLLCSRCGKPIGADNIAMMYFNEGYKFCCDSPACLSETEKKGSL